VLSLKFVVNRLDLAAKRLDLSVCYEDRKWRAEASAPNLRAKPPSMVLFADAVSFSLKQPEARRCH